MNEMNEASKVDFSNAFSEVFGTEFNDREGAISNWHYAKAKASELAGKEWNEFSSLETTDKGIEESASLMGKYRILLAEIRHREKCNDGRQISETRKP